ncbi:hypothetical protein ACHAWF_001022, partial [Thalassiosira exigua]
MAPGIEPARGRRERIAIFALLFAASCVRRFGREGGRRTRERSSIVPVPVRGPARGGPLAGALPGAPVDRRAAYDADRYCHAEGSLHRLAVDMVRRSSPPGSPSHRKFRRVLDANSEFYVDLGGARGIFVQNQRGVARMMRGYGLTQARERPPSGPSNVTLVETLFTSEKGPCPLRSDECRAQARAFVQTEQYFKEPAILCHRSPNCVILDFSEFNLRKARGLAQVKDFVDSFVLLPATTQSPSRLKEYEPRTPEPLANRSLDMVFFGEITNRRWEMVDAARAYERANEGRKVVAKKEHKPDAMGSSYASAKVCLLSHSYRAASGGEYHRLSEFGPFGCVPVMEEFGDEFGIDRYEKCGAAKFATVSELVPTAVEVVANIDGGRYERRTEAVVDWWRTGVQWERLLPNAILREDW